MTLVDWVWCQHFSGARAFLVSALFWCQSISGVSTFLVTERLWCQHFSGARAFLVSHPPTLTSMNNLANVLRSGQVRAGGRDTSTNTRAERDCARQRAS